MSEALEEMEVQRVQLETEEMERKEVNCIRVFCTNSENLL